MQDHRPKRSRTPHEDVLVEDLVPRIAQELHKRFAARLAAKPESQHKSVLRSEDTRRPRNNRAHRHVPVYIPLSNPSDYCERYQYAPLPFNLYHGNATPPAGIR
ncbi:hypothetical protein LAX5112_03439 [Roseibium alexandrii]|uniref:Uncharacterized protein n=1 Tax=Roseibium alexandrii TaxID=388408 RepID=A0A0M7AEU1_9HYPH|nr:hypothetical protein LAX5112_03439 [Roseibium alexandrii]